MNTRATAVALATRGFRVFRIAKGTKKHFIDSDWATSATCDTWAVWDRFSDPATGESVDCNIGILGGGIVVIDVDVPGAHHKKDGRIALEDLKTAGLDTNTFTVKTAGGGLHLYYNTAGKVFGNKPLAPGLEVKCYNGYVIGPGSTFDGGTYEIVNDAEPIDVPEMLAQRLAGVVDRAEGGPSVIGDLDTDAAIAGALEYLSKQEPAVEGEGGDNHTYRVCCGVLDFGLTVDTALDVMAEWDASCSPPWGEDLRRKLENAASHRQNPIGKNNPLNHYDAIDPALLAPPEPAFRPRRFSDGVYIYRDKRADIDALPPRPWIAYRRLMRGQISGLVAPGGTGKTQLALQYALALAVGRGEWCGLDLKEPGRQIKTLFVSGEDSVTELRMRLGAAAIHFGLDEDAIEENIHVYSARDVPFSVIKKKHKYAPLEQTEALADMLAHIKAHGIEVLIVDPLADVHQAEESNNSEMIVVMQTWRAVAEATQCAVLLVHHTRKLTGASSEGYAGNADSGRGASAIVNATRISTTFYAMSEKDAKEWGVDPAKRHFYLRQDDAKQNLALASPEADWFRRESLPLKSGESMGVLVPVKLRKPEPKPAKGAKTEDGEPAAIARLIVGTGSESMSLEAAAKTVADNPLYPEYSGRTKSRNFVSAMLADPVSVDGFTVALAENVVRVTKNVSA